MGIFMSSRKEPHIKKDLPKQVLVAYVFIEYSWYGNVFLQSIS